MKPYELLPIVQNEISIVSTELNVATNLPSIWCFLYYQKIANAG